MKKIKSKGSVGAEPEIPSAFLEGLRQAFQRPAHPELECPDPGMVISFALGELEAADRQKIQAHLLICRDCLELFLDVRLARAEVEVPEEAGQAPRKVGWLEAFGRKATVFMQDFLKPRKFIPALTAVSLVALVFILGREDRSKMQPLPQLALEQESSPIPAPSATPPPETTATKDSPTPPGRNLVAAKKKYDTTPAQEKATAPAGRISALRSVRLDFAEVAAPDGRLRLSYRADRDVYAYLLRQDPSGKTSLLHSGNLEAGKTYFYPAKDLFLKSDPSAVHTTVYLVAAEKPLPDLPTKIQDLEPQGMRQIQNLFPEAAIRSLAIKVP